MRTSGDLVARMQMHRAMKIKAAKKYVADKLGVAVNELADAAVMGELREELEIGSVYSSVGKPKGIEAQLREAILNAGMNRNQLSKLAGVDPAQLCYFVQGKRTLSLSSAEKIADALGLELVEKRSRKVR